MTSLLPCSLVVCVSLATQVAPAPPAAAEPAPEAAATEEEADEGRAEQPVPEAPAEQPEKSAPAEQPEETAPADQPESEAPAPQPEAEAPAEQPEEKPPANTAEQAATVEEETARTAPEADERIRVLVLDLTVDASDQRLAQSLSNGIALELARYEELEVVTAGDLRRMVELEADRQAVGCDTVSESCLAEIAGALDTRYVVFGDLTRVGKLRVLDVRLFDATEARPVARGAIRSEEEADLLERIPELLAPLLKGLGQTVTTPVVTEESSMWPLWTGAGTLAAGAAVVLVGLVVGGLGQAAYYAPFMPGQVKFYAYWVVLPAAAIGVVGLGAAAVGGGFVAWGLVGAE